MRTHLLRKHLLARLLLLIEVFDHVFERPELLLLLFMRKQRAGFGIDVQRGLAAGTDNCETVAHDWLRLALFFALSLLLFATRMIAARRGSMPVIRSNVRCDGMERLLMEWGMEFMFWRSPFFV